MHDTTPEIMNKVREMNQMRSPVECLIMGCSMYETSKYLIIRAILENNPQISKADLRKEIFLAFYGNDYDQNQREMIIKHLTQFSI